MSGLQKHILIYGILLALLALLLSRIEYYYQVRIFSVELYIVIIAVLFTVVGIWIGRKLTSPANSSDLFQRNQEALRSLAITDRELEVLELIAGGYSNQQIAYRLYISIHTVKSHVSNILDKMNADRRTQAIKRAKTLKLIP